ncbi:helix-turn-helix domain-containing protein [Flavonifractor plautii]|nr:helix-turn-helix domain-containing protein [Flavonifractor plautii]
MENKKTFGAYICRRRKELGLTQREFADRLFVTESAVSKWERGMSYPDITLIRDICAILQVSEHELLTASEDVEARTAETLAKKYLSLLRRLRWIQYILYGGTALICLICNLAVGHTLDWFWLVLTGELVGASLTLLPILVKQYRGVITLGASPSPWSCCCWPPACSAGETGSCWPRRGAAGAGGGLPARRPAELPCPWGAQGCALPGDGDPAAVRPALGQLCL